MTYRAFDFVAAFDEVLHLCLYRPHTHHDRPASSHLNLIAVGGIRRRRRNQLLCAVEEQRMYVRLTPAGESYFV